MVIIIALFSYDVIFDDILYELYEAYRSDGRSLPHNRKVTGLSPGRVIPKNLYLCLLPPRLVLDFTINLAGSE